MTEHNYNRVAAIDDDTLFASPFMQILGGGVGVGVGVGCVRVCRGGGGGMLYVHICRQGGVST